MSCEEEKQSLRDVWLTDSYAVRQAAVQLCNRWPEFAERSDLSSSCMQIGKSAHQHSLAVCATDFITSLQYAFHDPMMPASQGVAVVTVKHAIRDSRPVSSSAAT
jgi:hypothetical protein